MRRRHRYKEDYVIKEEARKDGSKKETVVYQGNHYELQISSEQKKKTVIRLILGLLLLLLIFAGIGSLNNEGSRVIYIMIPYVCLFLSFYYGLTGCFLLSRTKQKMTKLDYDKSLLRLKKSSMAGIILGFMTLIGEILTIFFRGLKFLDQKELIFISGVIFITISNIFIQKVTEKLIRLVKVTK